MEVYQLDTSKIAFQLHHLGPVTQQKPDLASVIKIRPSIK